MEHTCHALGCQTEIKPELLMCFKHWKMVPVLLQKGVWRNYRVGQCDDKRPSKGWLIAARRAICEVAVKEGLITRKRAAKMVEYIVEQKEDGLLVGIDPRFRS